MKRFTLLKTVSYRNEDYARESYKKFKYLMLSTLSINVCFCMRVCYACILTYFLASMLGQSVIDGTPYTFGSIIFFVNHQPINNTKTEHLFSLSF